HPFHEIFRHCFRTLNSIDRSRTNGQQFFRTSQWLDPLPRTRSRNDSNHDAAPSKSLPSTFATRASPMYLKSESALRSPVCSSSVLCRARFATVSNSASLLSIARRTSSAPSATSISRSGVKNASSPMNQSVTIGVPQAAASKNRPLGQNPLATISARVMFNVIREEEYSAEWSEGETWSSRCTFAGHCHCHGYNVPASRNRASGLRRDGSRNNASSFVCRSDAYVPI